MLDLLVFTQHPKAYGPSRFLQEAEKLGYRVKVVGYGLASKMQEFPDAKAVILREPDYKKNIYNLRDQILNYYISKKTKILNHKSYTKWSVLDKITQNNEFKIAGIPHIPLLKLSDAKYPYIIKNKLGSHGDSVYKIEGPEDLKKVLKKHKLEDLLIQEFLNCGFDLRVIVLGGRVMGIMKRTPKSGEFLSNYSQGGGIEQYNGTDINVIEDIAINTANHFSLEYVGVDLMKGNDGGWKVLEVNRACQFKGFEQATRVDLASKVVNYILN